MIRLLSLMVVMFSLNVFADPKIYWTYHNVKNNECHKECSKKILGNCVQWKEVCNYRTKWAWTDSEKSAVKAAMNLISNRIGNNRVETCIRNNVRKFMGSYAPTGKKEAQAWEDFHSLEDAKEWPRVNLTANREGGGVTGSAYVQRNAWGTDSGLRWRGEIGMSVNFDVLDSMIRDSAAAAAESYAGTIVHELLHQMGHTHPSTGDYSKDYEQGHFIVVAGDCIASNGDSARNTGLSLHGRRWYIAK